MPAASGGFPAPERDTTRSTFTGAAEGGGKSTARWRNGAAVHAAAPVPLARLTAEQRYQYDISMPTDLPYHYTGCGLDNVYLLSGYRITETPYGTAVAIDDIDGLYRAVGEAIVTYPARISGDELKFLRRRLGITQNQLGALIGGDKQKIGRWERGEVAVPPEADRLLRLIYLEKVRGNPQVCSLLERLADLDEPEPAQHRFTVDHGEWRLAG